jgi:hypothetical protein
MPKPSKRVDAIVTLRYPAICPACAHPAPERTSESAGVVRLWCPRCAWSERYLLVERMPDEPRVVKGGEHLAFKKRHRVGPHR